LKCVASDESHVGLPAGDVKVYSTGSLRVRTNLPSAAGATLAHDGQTDARGTWIVVLPQRRSGLQQLYRYRESVHSVRRVDRIRNVG